MQEKGKRCHPGLLLLRTHFKLPDVYFLKLGFMDGPAGLILAVASAYPMFVHSAKLREFDLLASKKWASLLLMNMKVALVHRVS